MVKRNISLISLILLSFLMGSCDSPSQKTLAPRIQSLSTTDSGDFGSLLYGQAKILTFNFTNDSSLPVESVPVLSSGVDFKIALSHRCAVIEPNSSCMVRVLFSTTEKTAGTYEDTLMVGDAAVALSAVVAGEGALKYEFAVNEVVVDGSLVLLPLKGNNLKVLNVRIKNNSPFVGSSSSLMISNPRFIKLSGCASVVLSPGRTCYAKVLVKAENVDEVLETSLEFDNTLVNLTQATEHEVIPRNMVAMESSFVLGDFSSEREKASQIIKVKNDGLATGSILSTEIELPAGFILVTNNCHNIKPQRTCYLQISYRHQEEEKGQHNTPVLIGDHEVDFVVNQVNKIEELTNIEISSQNIALEGSCVPVTISLKDHLGDGFVISSALELTADQTLYVDAACEVEGKTFAAFESSKAFYVKKETAGPLTLNVSYGATTSTPEEILFYPPVSVSAGTCGLDTPESLPCLVSASGGYGTLSFESSAGSIGLLSGEFVGSCEDGRSSTITVTDSVGNSAEVLVKYSCVYKSCLQAKLTGGLNTVETTASGSFFIDPDGLNNGADPMKVSCDQETDNGGWLVVISPTLSSPDQISNLQKLGSYNNLIGTYTATASGLSWGTNNSTYVSFEISSNIEVSQARIMYSGSYTGGLGYFIVGNNISNNTPLESPTVDATYLNFRDSHDANSSGQSLTVNGTHVFTLSQQNVTDRVDILLGNARAYAMSGYTSAYGYTRRYIKQLLVRENQYAVSCFEAYQKGIPGQNGTMNSGYWTIDPDGYNRGAAPYTVYCNHDNGGGWTLVAYSSGAVGTGNLPANFFVAEVNKANMSFAHAPGTRSSSLNVEAMSAALKSNDAMLIAPAYSETPYIDLGIGRWNYDTTRCSGTLRRTSRTAGCAGQGANDNFDSADRFNIALGAFSGSQAIVPNWLNQGNELCYSGKGWCTFFFYLR